MKLTILKKWSVLIEWLIVLTFINLIMIYIFSYIREVQFQNVQKVHNDRSSLLINWVLEKIISSRNTFWNINRRSWWDNFTKIINKTDSKENLTQYYHLINTSDKNYIKWHWRLENSGGLPYVFKSKILPYSNYNIYIQAYFPMLDNNSASLFQSKDYDKVIFKISISWNNNKANNGSDIFNSIEQSLLLTNNQIYENLY